MKTTTKVLPPGRYVVTVVVNKRGKVLLEEVDHYRSKDYAALLGNPNSDPSVPATGKVKRAMLFAALTPELAVSKAKDRKVYNRTY